MVAAARQNLFLSGWPKELERLLPRLEEAEARGVQVWVLVYGRLDVSLRRCYYHEPPSLEGRLSDVLPAFVVVSDHGEALPASVSEAAPVTGLWTRNRGVALIAAEYVKHDIFLAALTQRLGPELPKSWLKCTTCKRCGSADDDGANTRGSWVTLGVVATRVCLGRTNQEIDGWGDQRRWSASCLHCDARIRGRRFSSRTTASTAGRTNIPWSTACRGCWTKNASPPSTGTFSANTARIRQRKYDTVLRLQSLVIGCWEPAERRRMVELLDAPAGGRVLEVAVGTGANLPFLSRLVGPEGQIIGADLSMAMIDVARRRARSLPSSVYFVRADACHLPFADDTFDAVFHFGGLNMFGDVGAALREMVRVAKPGAPIVAGDEGMSEARRRTWLGRRLGRMNSLNLCRPPLAEMPWDDVDGFELHWAWRELFYVMRFRKAAAQGESVTGGGTESPSMDPVVREMARRARW